MNIRLSIATLVFAAVATPAAAQEAPQPLPTVKAETVRYVVDCEDRKLPSQREVGEWTGQHNFSQVYATRQRLMAEIGRGCQKVGIEQVQVVSRINASTHDLQLVAAATRRGR